MKKYHIFVYTDKKPLDNLILYKICTECGVMFFDGFNHDRGLYDFRLTFTSKKKRENVADFLAYKGFKFIYPEYTLQTTPESSKKSKRGRK